ncbi:MAG: single-stranded DNA-binding protein [Actinomycetales bacterium]|nr:single-stranded DNA-binding protein [Actinomycetales bacterium]
MSDQITLTGLVATTPRHLVTSEGLPITSFRLASTRRRFDRGQQKWIDGETNWFTVTAFRQLAINTVGSIAKGQRVLVTGRLRVRDWESGERAGTTVEVDADALGHDLTFGTADFTRSLGGGSGAGSRDDAPESDAEAAPSAPEGDDAAEAGADPIPEAAALPF